MQQRSEAGGEGSIERKLRHHLGQHVLGSSVLAARPLATGLAVPGMPAGSPGMDFPGVVPEPYEVFLFGPSVQKTFGRFRGAREI